MIILKKYNRLIVCLAAAVLIGCYFPIYDSFISYAESQTTEETEEESSNEVSQTAVILTVLGIFTVTTAAVSVVTFKMRRKKFLAEEKNNQP